jgi:hypothetical protein
MPKLVRIVGKIWLFALGLIVVLSGVVIIFTDGIWKFWEIYSPFNIWQWGLVFILALPGFGLIKLADRMDKKRAQ